MAVDAAICTDTFHYPMVVLKSIDDKIYTIDLRSNCIKDSYFIESENVEQGVTGNEPKHRYIDTSYTDSGFYYHNGKLLTMSTQNGHITYGGHYTSPLPMQTTKVCQVVLHPIIR
jgi:hypothetical protein